MSGQPTQEVNLDSDDEDDDNKDVHYLYQKIMGRNIRKLLAEATAFKDQGRCYLNVYNESESPVNQHYFIVEADLLFK